MRPIERSLLCGALLAFVGAANLAQTTDNQQQTTRPSLFEMVDVTVANVEVVVTDPDGNRVRGLQREDFQILEGGVLQKISNFAEIGEPKPAPTAKTAVAAPAPEQAPPPETAATEEAPPRRIVIFVDLMTMDMFQRKRVLASLAPLLDEITPRDEVMVVSWNGSLETVVDPTSDAAVAREGLARLGKQASLSRAAKLRLDQGTSGNWRRQAVQMAANDLKRSVYAVRGLLTRLQPVGGRKVLILITEGFEMQPGRELLTTDDPFGLDTPASSIPGPDGSLGMRLDTPLFEMESGEGPDLIKSVAQLANAAGVTLYTVHGGGLSATSGVEHLSILSEYFLPRADMPNQREPDLNRPMTSDMNEIVRDRIRNSIEGLTHLAERSGGVVARNTNDYRAVFRDIAADLSSYYSLGYRVTSGTEGERHIEVRMRDPRLTARARRSITIRSAESEIADAVVANLAFPRTSNELGIWAEADPAERTGRKNLSVPVDVKIPLEPLSFVEEGDAFVANVAIYLGAADSGNITSEVRRFDQPIRIARADFEKIGGAHYTYRLTVDLRSRTAENRISVGVMDSLSKMTGFAVLDVGSKK
jgi:VWFA-related protein